jgi:predicted DNA binding CopG/RHH family protein
MKKNYDFSKGIKNPYAKKLKRQVTIRLEVDTLTYFKELALNVDLPYQKLINLFLRDCAEHKKKLSLHWNAKAA